MNKKVESLCMLIVFAGFVVIMGTAGASDLGQIDFNQTILQGIGGVVLMLIGYIGLKVGGSENVY